MVSIVTSRNTLIDMEIGDFSTDPSVQRALNQIRVDKLAKDFNPLMLGLITASRRLDGRSYILDGQHRIAAARKARYGGVVATRLYEGLSVAEESEIFLGLNNTRKVNALDKFNVRVTMGDPGAVAINNALKNHGLRESGRHTNGMFAAIMAIERVYAGFLSYGAEPRLDLVEGVLNILVMAYPGLDRKAFQANTVQGVGLILEVFGRRVDKKEMIAALQGITAEQLAVRGRSGKDMEGGTGAEGVARVILSIYNKGKASRRLDFRDFADGVSRIRKNDRLAYESLPERAERKRRSDAGVKKGPRTAHAGIDTIPAF